MSSQEELLEQLPMGVMVIWDASVDYESWEAPSDTGSMIITQMNDTGLSPTDGQSYAERYEEIFGEPFDPNNPQHCARPINGTMIYTGEEAKGLADQAVDLAVEAKKVADKLSLSEEEKARLWRAVMESCSG